MIISLHFEFCVLVTVRLEFDLAEFGLTTKETIRNIGSCRCHSVEDFHYRKLTRYRRIIITNRSLAKLPS